MLKVIDTGALASVEVPDSLLGSIHRVLANAQQALKTQRENIAALTDVNTRLMLECLERDRTIHELQADVRRIAGEMHLLKEKVA